jgi:hypothetical protein
VITLLVGGSDRDEGRCSSAGLERVAPAHEELVDGGCADDRLVWTRQVRRMEDEGPRLAAPEAAVERDQFFECAAFVRSLPHACDRRCDGRRPCSTDQGFIAPFRVPLGSDVVLGRDFDPADTGDFFTEEESKGLLAEGVNLLDHYQSRLAAQDTYGVLMVLQALDCSPTR